MNEAGVRWVAGQLGVALDDQVSDTGWIQGPCPFASWTHPSGCDENPSFAISVTTGQRRWSSFTCLACKAGGRLSSLAFKLGRLRHHHKVALDVDYKALGERIEEMEIFDHAAELPDWEDHDAERRQAEPAKPDEVDPLAYPSAVGHPYLGRRGVHWNTALRLGLLVDRFQKRILFPVRDWRGRLRGYTGRAYAPTFLRNGRPAPKVRDYLGLPKRDLLLGEHGIDARPRDGSRLRRVVVVEGLFDYARLVQHRVGNVVALLGSEVTPGKLERLRRFDLPIVWMTDPDPAGQACLFGPIDPLTGQPEREKGALYKLRNCVPQMLVEYPRPVDPADLTRAEVARMLRNTRLYVR